MNFKIPLFLTLLLLAFASCSDFAEEEKLNAQSRQKVGYTAQPEYIAAADTERQPTVKNESVKTQKKIIKNGTMTVESDDAAKSKSALNKTILKLEGYYEKEDVQNDHRSTTFSLVVRVPAKNFEKLIQSIEKGGDNVSNKSITADDVTEDFYDVKTRLANKRAYLKRYQELLNRAGTIQDILDVEEKIRVLEEEIESAEGRLRYLGDQVGHSTLHLTLFEKKAYYNEPHEDTFSDRVARAFSNGWSAIVHFFIALLTLWPFILVGGIAVFVFRRYRRKQKNSKS